MEARALDRLDFDRLVVFWTYRRKDERKTPEMNVSDRVLFSKEELAQNIIRASSTMRLKLTTRYGFGLKIVKFNNFGQKSTKNKGNH